MSDSSICPLCNGSIESNVKATISNVSCEISFICKKCGEVGYWAYGYFHPDMPYQG